MKRQTKFKWRKRRARLRNWWSEQFVLRVALGVFIGMILVSYV